MRREDITPFGQLLDRTCRLLSRGAYVPDTEDAAMFFRALARFTLDEVRAGFDAHVADPQRGRFVPVPADIIAQIEQRAAADGRPGADEAWALALAGRDERNTIVWTAETAEAWGIAVRVLDAGDEVGARVAFRDAYNRLVAEARAARRPMERIVSEGHIGEERRPAIEHAVTAGLLPAPEAAALLPAPDGGHTLGSLLEIAPPEHRERLRAGYQVLLDKTKAPSFDECERKRTAELKERVLERVSEYRGGA